MRRCIVLSVFIICWVFLDPFKTPTEIPHVFNATTAQAETPVQDKTGLSELAMQLQIEINIPQTELVLYKAGQVLKRARIAVGSREFQTPEYRNRSLELRNIIWNPDWTPPKSKWAAADVYTPPGPANPLGVVKMPIFGTSGILLHGTNKPNSIGLPASHGCLRLNNDDAKSIAWILQQALTSDTEESYLRKYEEMRGKTFYVSLSSPIPVRIRYEPVEIIGNEIHVYQDMYKKVGQKPEHLLTLLTQSGISESRIDRAVLKTISQEWNRGKNLTLLVDDLLIEELPEPSQS